MKKSKKLKKDVSRLGSYLKKETARLEKLISHAFDGEGSQTTAEIWRRLQDRQSAALADLEMIRAAESVAKPDEQAPPETASGDGSSKKAKEPKQKPVAEAGKKLAAPKAKKAAPSAPASKKPRTRAVNGRRGIMRAS